MRVSVIRDVKEFRALREEWNALLDRCRSRSVFLRWEWLYNWWLAFGRGNEQLRILVVRDNERTIGIAPLYERIKHFNALREVRFLGSNLVCSDYLDFILLESHEREGLTTILKHLQENRDNWDVIFLTDMPSASENSGLVKTTFGTDCVYVDHAYTECPYIDLEGGWDSISLMMSSSHRMNIRRKVRKFGQIKGATFVEVEAREELGRYFDEFVRLNRLRMRMKKQVSPFLDDEFIRFHRRIVDEMFEEGIAKLFFLRIGAELIGGIYLFVFGEKYYYYQSGFDPAWSKLSPGILMFRFCIQDAVERGAREFDFLQGGEAYKYLWTNRKRLNTKTVVYNKTVNGKIARFLNKCIFDVRSSLRRMRTWMS